MSDWLGILYLVGIVFAGLWWHNRETRGQMLRRYLETQRRLKDEEAALERAKSEKWQPHALARLEMQVQASRMSIEQIERQR